MKIVISALVAMLIMALSGCGTQKFTTTTTQVNNLQYSDTIRWTIKGANIKAVKAEKTMQFKNGGEYTIKNNQVEYSEPYINIKHF